MGCPDENQLAAYADGGGRQRHVVARHLDQCAACRRVVSALARLGVEDVIGDDEATAMQVRASQLGSSPSIKQPTASLSPDPELQLDAGTMVGEYMVTGPLGAGGMGAVYAAIHPRIGKRVAIKVLKRDVKKSPVALVRFENEARVVNAICHPNLVDIFAFGELPDGNPYLVMELVDGESLEKWLCRGGPVSLSRAMPILRPIFDALTAAHQSGVIHRDLKPGNIMISNAESSAPRIKVLDFGLAKVANPSIDADLELTIPGSVMGTPLFMSPEQLLGVDVDHRSDVYALGVIVYLMLCGIYPYLGESPSQVQLEQLQNQLRLPSTFVSGLPPQLDSVLAKALAKNVTERYQSVADFRAALERCISPSTVQMLPRKTAGLKAPAAPAGVEYIASNHAASTIHADAARAPRPAAPIHEASTILAEPATPAASSPKLEQVAPVPELAVSTSSSKWRWIVAALLAFVVVGSAIIVVRSTSESREPDVSAKSDNNSTAGTPSGPTASPINSAAKTESSPPPTNNSATANPPDNSANPSTDNTATANPTADNSATANPTGDNPATATPTKTANPTTGGNQRPRGNTKPRGGTKPPAAGSGSATTPPPRAGSGSSDPFDRYKARPTN